ncbi:MAG: hypothetical protein ACQETJ_02485 [Bacteroidota bacterium]
MDVSIKIDQIVKQVSSLDYNSKIQVAEKIISLLKAPEKKDNQPNKLTDLKGLGTEVWENIDVNDYLQNERSWE